MKGLLIRWVLPAGIFAVLFALLAWAQRAGFVPDAVAFWVWPSLIAICYLTFGLLSLLFRRILPLWPLGAAFFVQVVGLFLLGDRTFLSLG